MRRLWAYNPELWVPATYRPAPENAGVTGVWPTCDICKGPVESYEIVHEGSKSLDIVARCHGKEDCLKIAWEDENMTMSDFISELQRTVFFHGLVDR